MRTTAEILRELRGEKTQREVAEAIGVTKQAYSLYENGMRVPRDPVKRRLSEYYHLPIGYIFYQEAQQIV